MNRYIVNGIMQDLREGRFVALVSPTLRDSAAHFKLIAECAEEDQPVTQIVRANGRQSITTPNGGHLMVIAANMNGGRGFNADTVVVAEHSHLTRTQWRDISEYAIVTCAELIQG